MKEYFKEFYKLSNEETKSLWGSCLFIFDTNVLLNFYRYSDETVTELLQLLTNFKDRIWIPYQVGKEFHNRFLNVIQDQIKVYNDSITKIALIEKDFSNKDRSPFVHSNLLGRFSNIIQDIINELNDKKAKYEIQLTNDHMSTIVSDLFYNKIGEEFSIEVLEEIYEKGKKRFDQKIPPGYEDNSKPDPEKYGDLVLWFEILSYAEKNKKSVIFITDDKKNDWWLIISGKTIGPRPELRKEFYTNTKQQFYMYSPLKFLEHAKEFLHADIKPKTINEVKELNPVFTHSFNINQYITLITRLRFIDTDHKLNLLIQQIEGEGYYIAKKRINENEVELVVTLPKIDDLPRRFEKRFLINLNAFKLDLIEYKVLNT